MADSDRDHIVQLVERPGESLNVEIKTWISPSDKAGQAKIVKGCLALRNRGGGFLVIGIDDRTMLPDTDNAPTDVRSAFHADIIQPLVAKYASEPFQVTVEFVERDGLEHPVIVIPPGVRTPVAAKADLKDGETFLIRADAVYFRTLNANNSVSSAAIKWNDWRDLVEICLENREADIGRFLRRHLAGVGPSVIQDLVAALAGAAPVPAQQPSDSELLETLLNESRARFDAVLEERVVGPLPSHGSWEVALIIDGAFPSIEVREFQWRLNANNPDYTGWPVWLDSSQFSDEESRPNFEHGAWETLIVRITPAYFNHIDFTRVDPRGRFYSYRALEDDITNSNNAPTPMTSLDIGLPTLRVAESIAVGLAFAKALQVEDQSVLRFAFRWCGLKDRELSSWADPMRLASPYKTRQDVVTSTVSVPVDTPLSAIAQYVKVAVEPLYQVFKGFAMPGSAVEDLTQRLLDRRL